MPADAWANWYRVVDVRITKTFAVRRGAHLSLIGEAFNLFNAENHAGYFGELQTRTGEPRADFGATSSIYATRQLQVGTRLQF